MRKRHETVNFSHFTRLYCNMLFCLGTGVYAYAILKDDATISPEDLRNDLKGIVRQKIGSFAVPEVIQVSFFVLNLMVAVLKRRKFF